MGDRHMRSRTFWRKFNSEQLSFQAFFHMMRIFGSTEHLTECILPLLNNIIFQSYRYFELPGSTPREDRHMRSQTFLDKIEFQTTFILSFFPFDANFGSVEPYIECILPFLYIIKFQTY